MKISIVKTRFAFLALLFGLFFVQCHPGKTSSGGDDGRIEVWILQMNDVYEIAPLGSDGLGGLARVAALRKQLMAQNPNVLTVMAGDFISPSVTGVLKHDGKRIRGKQMVATLNTLGLDCVVFGNHEFDYDQADLQERIDESNFTWLGANARLVTPDGAVPFYKNKNGVKENCPDNTTYTFKDADGTEIKLGLFGVLINTGKKDWVQYTDWNEAAMKQYADLKPRTDVVLGLTHLSIDDDKKLAGLLPGVPLLMGGHDHDNMMHTVGASKVTKADANARTVYVHKLLLDKKTGKVDLRSELRTIDASLGEEPATAQVVQHWEDIKNKALNDAGFNPTEKVAELTEPLDCRDAFVRVQAAPVGDLVTSAMMAASRRKPDCAIWNSGSLRIDDVLKGQVVVLDVVRMLPFGGGLTEVDMTGALLRRTLAAGKSNLGNGGFLQTKNMVYDDLARQWYVGEQPLSDSKMYKVILPEFLLTGNEQNMGFLKSTPEKPAEGIQKVYPADPKNTSDLRTDIRKALISYWKQQ